MLIFWKCFMFGKYFESVFWKCLVFVLKISKDFWFESEQATRNNLPTQKSLFISSFPLILLSYHLFGKKPYLWMWRDGRGSSYSQDSNVVKYLNNSLWGTKIILKGNIYSVIEGLWSCIFDLFLLRYLACISWPFYFKATKWVKP